MTEPKPTYTTNSTQPAAASSEAERRKRLRYKRLLAAWSYHRACMREIAHELREDYGRSFSDPFPVDVNAQNG